MVWGYIDRDRQRLYGMTINTKKKRLIKIREEGEVCGLLASLLASLLA